MAKMRKTNAMRVIEQKGCLYDAVEIGKKKDNLNWAIYKTLVTVGKSGEHYVFEVPLASELDLKKAAKAVGEKSIQMIEEKELQPLTGYVHGGCSPIAMKKEFPTVIDTSAFENEKIAFSAGKVGVFILMDPHDLQELLDCQVADIQIKELK